MIANWMTPVGGALTLLSAVLGVLAARSYRHERAEQAEFEPVPATVERSWLAPRDYDSDTGARHGFQPRMIVSFQRSGAVHRAELAEPVVAEDRARLAPRLAPAGSLRTIWVNRADPSQVRLALGWNFETYRGTTVFGGLAAALLLNGLVFLAKGLLP